MSLKAIIVEDEKHSRETLKNLLEEFCVDVKVIETAANVDEAVTKIAALHPDVVFLDIELQTGTGFDVLSQLRDINFEVIFTTAFEQYAIKAVKFSSLDYLLKPIDLEELQKSIEKAKKKKNQDVYKKQLETLMLNLKQQHPKLNKICLSTADGFEFINTADILYCKAEGSYTTFILNNNSKLLVSKHLKEYESLLLEQQFMRVHNSFLINLNEVKKFVKSDGGYIIMNNNDVVSISRSKKDEFLELMNNLMH
ncbi:LytTR family DNA-binding domain-containing protein [Flavobacterium sp. AS60]|uniref:LytR/AlgR family response regulator transcription factor n=1 Tax=Flavobacterium anseongense TaxID=2910677 RepID=UPI001F3CE453|nr:LytTR family DNA-binding domain-containing protein [Flavobacterium sp. AS60]MCF6130269.1 LytTR family DNA-binding domain-containing protein [Flavobacterium sp. AS60]